MKKLLLNIMLILASGLMVKAEGQTNQAKGESHQARFHVYSHKSKTPVQQASVIDKNGKELGQTDTRGNLVLTLPASPTDQYTIKAEGYKSTNVRLTQAKKTTADYDVFLPISTGEPNVKSGTTASKEKVETPKETEMVKVYVRQDPEVYKKENVEEGSSVEFAVQLSATSRPITDKSSLRSWEELGSVFIHNENGLYKVRIGPFNSQESAKQVLLQVKARGKKDAFIVVQKGIENHVPFDFATHYDDPEIKITPPAKSPSTRAADPVNKGEVVEYKVRLASYLKPGGFNTKDIDQYGPLESYRKGDWTIMLIGGFKTAQDAERVKNLVVAKGYVDASVVVDRGGVLESEH